MTFPRFLALPFVLLVLVCPPLAAQNTSSQEGTDRPTVVDSDTLPSMAEIEQAWARGDYVFVRQALKRHVEETDSALAQYRYGRVLLEGRGGPHDVAAARDWLEKAAARKQADAETLLARLYLSSPQDGPDYRPERAVQLLSSAAARGKAEAQYYLGLALRAGTGGDADPVAAFNWFLAAAEQQYVAAQYELSRAYSRGEGIEKDNDAAVRWLSEAAQNGHTEAQFFLARALDLGQGMPRNRGEAVSWLRRAAEAGHVLSQRTLGRKYLLASGVEGNPQEALRWLSEAAAAEDSEAMALLGDAYGGSLGLPADPDRAWGWYRKASEYGNGRATTAVASMLERGVGRPADPEAAAALYRKALEQQGDPGAARELGRMAGAGMLAGLIAPHVAVPWAIAAAAAGDSDALDWVRAQAEAGIRPAQTALAVWLLEQETNPEAAAPFFEAAAQRGDVEAQYRLGMLLTRGEGVEQDYVAGHAWLNIAAAGGHSEAVRMRGVVSDLMTAEQVAEAQTVARNFFQEARTALPVLDETSQ